MTVAVVTPWYCHRELAADYLDAMRIGPPPDELLIVDDGSTPPLPFATVRLENNSGFAHACNVGLRAAEADVVVFLNNDVYAVEDGWLQELADEAEEGVLVGCSLRRDPHADVDGRPLPYLDGWCIGGMRDDLCRLGGFDEEFAEPAYFGDNDLCVRARAAGMKLREVRVGVRHKLNQTVEQEFWPAEVAKAAAANYVRYAARARQLKVLV